MRIFGVGPLFKATKRELNDDKTTVKQQLNGEKQTNKQTTTTTTKTVKR